MMLAPLIPTHRAKLQDAGGFLLMGGLFALGLAFAMI
jgi:hypothetical protein